MPRIHSDVLRKAIGRDIRIMREETGLSQDSVAAVCGNDRSGRQWVSKIENGANGMSLESFLAIMDYLRNAQNADHPGHALSTHFKRRQQFVD